MKRIVFGLMFALAVFIFGADAEKVWAAWGSDTMGSYARGTRDVLTQWNPADQQLARFILEKRPDVKALMLKRDPNNNEPNMVNDWVFGGSTGNWRFSHQDISGWPSEIKQAGHLIAYAKQLGWQDTSPVYKFSDGTTRTQAEMGAELARAGWGGENGSILQNNGATDADVLTAYLRTTGKTLATASPSPSPSTGQATPTGTISTSPNPCTIGVGGADATHCGTTVTWSTTGVSDAATLYVRKDRSNTDVCSGDVVWNTPTGPQSANWIDTTGYYFHLCTGTTHLAKVFVKGNTGGTGTISTTHYKVASNPEDLDNDTTTPWKVYTSDTSGQMDIPYSFVDTTPGQKFVWVQYKYSDKTKSGKISKSINFAGADPAISKALECNLDTSGVVNFKVKGVNFGSSKGSSKLTANGSNITIDDWKDSEITGQLNSTTAAGTQKFEVTLTRGDGASAVSSNCELGVALISLGAKLFCQLPSKVSASDVKISIVEEAIGSAISSVPVREVVTIDTKGLIQGLKTKVQDGKKYKLAIKVPGGLRKQVEFTANKGTAVIPNLTLPVGDIQPDEGNGKIDTFDLSELFRQWVVGTAATGRTGDFNSDGRVNSIDYACLRQNFGQSEAADL